MTPSDRTTLLRYIAILEGLTASTPQRALPGHQRGIYQPLAAYIDVRRTDGTRVTIDPLSREVLEAALPPGPLRAGEASRIARLAWCAIAAWAGECHRPQMADFLTDLASRQQPAGPFLLATASDNPEPLWYHELVLLHALATFATLSPSPDLLPAIGRSALFHLHETQPDHATTEPWAVHAFAGHLDTLPLADTLLHAAQAQHGGNLDAISWMLLSDALYCLQQSTESNH